MRVSTLRREIDARTRARQARKEGVELEAGGAGGEGSVEGSVEGGVQCVFETEELYAKYMEEVCDRLEGAQRVEYDMPGALRV